MKSLCEIITNVLIFECKLPICENRMLKYTEIIIYKVNLHSEKYDYCSCFIANKLAPFYGKRAVA